MRLRGLSRLQRNIAERFETRGGVGQSLSMMAVVLALTLFAVDRLMGHPMDLGGWMELVIAAMGGAAWFLLQYRWYRLVAWSMVATLFLVATSAAYFFGSARTVTIYLIGAALVVGGLFLGQRALIWVTLAAIALLGGWTWADVNGFLLEAPNFAVGIRTWGVQSATLSAVSMMVYANRTQLRAAQDRLIQEAKQRLQAKVDRDDGLERFKLVFGSSPTAIFVQSYRTGVILDANPAFEWLTGYVRRDVLNRRDGFLWLQDAQHAAFDRQRRGQLRTEWLPIQCVRKDGPVVDLLICSEISRDPADGLVITVLRQVGSGTLQAPLSFASRDTVGDAISEMGLTGD